MISKKNQTDLDFFSDAEEIWKNWARLYGVISPVFAWKSVGPEIYFTNEEEKLLSSEEILRWERLKSGSSSSRGLRALSQWIAGRKVLQEAQKKLPFHPKVSSSFSLTHTWLGDRGVVVAIGGAFEKGHGEIGIDLEAQGREVRPQVLDRLGWSEEIQLGLTPLQLWNLKEAAFKAGIPGGPTWISPYQLKKFDADRLEGLLGLGTDWETSSLPIAARIHFSETWSLAFAVRTPIMIVSESNGNSP